MKNIVNIKLPEQSGIKGKPFKDTKMIKKVAIKNISKFSETSVLVTEMPIQPKLTKNRGE